MNDGALAELDALLAASERGVPYERERPNGFQTAAHDQGENQSSRLC